MILSVLLATCLQAAGRRAPARRATKEIIVKFRAPQSGQSATEDSQAKRIAKLSKRWPVRRVDPLTHERRAHARRRSAKASDLTRVYRIRLDDQTDVNVEEILASYRAYADVEYAEVNPIVSICAEPDDPLFTSQWALAKIAAAQAWDTCRGSAEVVVAVIDTGVDYRHRDLEANAWRNRAEFNGLPNVDDDDNGFVDDVWGYNFIYNDNEPMDDHGHGTHCAGTIAAVGDNELDISGLCWNARIMPIKILGDDGDGNAADAALAVYYAVANGAHVISASWGGPEPSELLEEALAYAHSHGVVTVAAAGNEDTDELFYPAAYSQAIGVAATDTGDRRWSSSNYGPWVDVAAPGHAIVSLRPAGLSAGFGQDPYTAELSGTSMAAPHIAGAVALLRAANPFLTPDEIRQILLSTGDPIAPGTCVSNARLNLAQTMEATVPLHGDLRFDRPVYAQDSDIEVLLADAHLKGAATQTITIETTGGDTETVTLVETPSALGVFRATLSSQLDAPVPGDGRIQVADGQQIVARYRDADDGAGNVIEWTTAEAIADAQPPAVIQVAVEMVGPLARVEVLTDEPTTAQIRYARLADSDLEFSSDASESSEFHQIKLRRLVSGSEYRFVIDLVDAAGNETTADNDGAGYTFLAEIDRDAFRVPAVYATIQDAIDDAWDGDTIWIADGTYSGPGNIEIDLQGKAITVRSENGPQACIIDCQAKGGGFYAHSGEDEDTLVEGLTITNANSDFGSAFLCIASSPTIRNCRFVANQATRYGAGLCNYYGADPLVVDCHFEDNTATSEEGRGGAIANRRGSSPTIRNCTFIDNEAAYVAGAIENYDESHPRILDCYFEDNESIRGGAVFSAYGSDPTVKRCRFTDNTAQFGAAIYNRDYCTVTIEHTVFTRNRARSSAAALGNFQSDVTMTHCTVVANHADSTCGGIDAGRRGSVHLQNCIVWGNTDSSTSTPEGASEQAQLTRDTSDLTVDYSCVQDWTATHPGLGTFDADPRFAAPANGDFHLRSAAGRYDPTLAQWVHDTTTSPCIDAGNPGYPLRDEPLTLPGDPDDTAATNTRVNMGAHGGTPEASLAPIDWMLPADITNDRTVDFHDLTNMTAAWLHTDSKQPADLTRDGIIDAHDLTRLANQWRHQAAAPSN